MNKNIPYLIFGGIAVGNYLLPAPIDMFGFSRNTPFNAIAGGLSGYLIAKNLNKKATIYTIGGLVAGVAIGSLINGMNQQKVKN
jgi:hypothetical protein